MANLGNNLDEDIGEETSETLGESKLNKKKLMLILLPALIIIASIGFYYKSQNKKNNTAPINYSIIEHSGEDATSSYTILYDLPEIEVRIPSIVPPSQLLRVKINIELTNIDNIPIIDSLTAKLSDTIISHVSSLTAEEISGSEGLYWLKKELLYRLNLITLPVKITNLNFKSFELLKG